MLTTASLAVSRQILHSNILSSFSFSSPLLFLEEPGSLAAAILALSFVQLQPHCKITQLVSFLPNLQASTTPISYTFT